MNQKLCFLCDLLFKCFFRLWLKKVDMKALSDMDELPKIFAVEGRK